MQVPDLHHPSIPPCGTVCPAFWDPIVVSNAHAETLRQMSTIHKHVVQFRVETLSQARHEGVVGHRGYSHRR